MSRRLYSLFEKRGFRYHRISQLAYPKAQAVLVFQDMLLAGPAHYLRPVSDTWSDGHRVYSPPVEQLGILLPAIQGSEKRLRDVIERKVGERHVLEPRCRTYSTPPKPKAVPK